MNKVLVILIAFLFVQSSSFGQRADGYFHNTLTIMDNITNEASERVSRSKKEIKHNFYLKADGTSYHLFKGNQANLTSESISNLLSSGFSLYIDKLEHMGHKNLKPSTMLLLDDRGEVTESFENISELKRTEWDRILAKDALIRFSGFVISVNEEELGPIQMDVKIVE